MNPIDRIDPYEEWIPQFKDGSGWNLNHKPCFIYYYEEISKKEAKSLVKNAFPVTPSDYNKKTLFRITCLLRRDCV